MTPCDGNQYEVVLSSTRSSVPTEATCGLVGVCYLLLQGFVVTLGFISVVASAALTLNGYRK